MSRSTPPPRHFHSLAVALLAVLSAVTLGARAEDASAQNAQKAKEEVACKQTVNKFEQAMDFMRETQGSTWTSAFKEKKLPAAVEKEILKKDGYCGLSKYLKHNKLI